MKFVIDDKIPYLKGLLEQFSEVEYIAGADIKSQDVRDADGLLIRTRTRCDARLLSGSAVKFIGTATIGTDHIDLDWCRSNDIEVASAPGSNSAGVLQWVAACLALISAKECWRPSEKTLGVVGVGNVGSLVARYASSWGFRVVCCDPPRETSERLSKEDGFLPLGELARLSDIVTFHVPLTAGGDYPTRNLADKKFLNHIRRGTILMNSSRGGIVDERELLGAVESNNLTACIDTWLSEPKIDRWLLAACSIATPHIAGYTAQGKANATAMIVGALSDYFSLPLSGWFPPQVQPVQRADISWNDMTDTIVDYFDISRQSALLKDFPEDFESFRSNYLHRREYF